MNGMQTIAMIVMTTGCFTVGIVIAIALREWRDAAAGNQPGKE